VKLNSALCLLVATGIGLFGASASAAPGADGDAILRRAATANGALRSFTVPVHFDVAVHKVISMKVGVDGTNYFRAPDQEALVVTKTAPVIGGAFKGNYGNLVTLPQVWPGHYKVARVRPAERDGQAVFELWARPRVPEDVDHVVFDVTRTGFEPLSAAWFYHDGSTIRIGITNDQVGRYTLPRTENIVVRMPKDHFEATAHYGRYALNAPVPSSVFTSSR
jgi:hypothetical protein